MTNINTPHFDTIEFLEKHAQFILAFYEPRVVADDGFYQCFKDNGDVYDANTRHLVSSTRFIFNYATAYRRYQKTHYREWALHGLKHLTDKHLQHNGNFVWELNGEQISDDRCMAYGHAFVMLCASTCVLSGIDEAKPLIEQTWQFINRYFWDEEHQAYADERNGDLSTLDPYRGQNANMHTCEALIAAHAATGESTYLDRAATLANKFAFELAEQSNGLIWEHYDANWDVDLEYNIDKPDDLFKPWGFQPGHQVEWTKLLLQINAVKADKKWVDKAAFLFNEAMEKGWDNEHGGLVYGFAPDGSFADSHKYFWVHAEAMAAAWRLYAITEDTRYHEHYLSLWDWSWRYLIDHKYGAWFRIRNRDGSAFDDLKSPPGKTDYHTLGAVWDIIDQMSNNNNGNPDNHMGSKA